MSVSPDALSFTSPAPGEADRAILRTIAYASLFEAPLTVDELHRALMDVPLERDDLRRRLEGPALRALVEVEDGLVIPRGHRDWLGLRRARQRHSRALVERHRAFLDRIARFPFVRLVALSGGCAHENATDDDVDVFLVVERGRAWGVCLALMVLTKWAGLRRSLCLNYIVDEDALALPEHDVFTAAEIVGLKPLADAGAYRRFVDANRWAAGRFPNFFGSVPAFSAALPPAGVPSLERMLRWGPALLFEWAARATLEPYLRRKARGATGVALERHRLKLHLRDHRPELNAAFAAAVESLELGAASSGKQGPLPAQRRDPRVTEVLFGQAYHLRFDPKLVEAGQPYPPLGTLYAAAVARAAGHDVALHDSMLARSERDWAESLERHRPRVAVLYEDSFNYLTKMCLLRMREAALAMIQMARARGCTVLVAGSDATDHPAPYLDAGAAAVLAGEAELTLRDALAAVAAGGAEGLADVDGVVRRGPAGALVRTAARPLIRDLEALPYPAWDLVDVERYRGLWRKRHGYHSMNIASTRGCPYHCNWCAKPIYGQRYHARNPAGVAAEMAWLKRAYAPDHLAFADDIFGLRPGWVERFAEEVSARDAHVPFKCLSRADLLDDATVGALRAAGCRTVWIGAESGSQRILDAMEKGTTVEQIRDAARRLRGAGIEVGFFLQFGYPGETRADIERTRALVRECRPNDIGISVSYPLPGTPFHERVRAQMGAKRNWDDSADLAMMYRGPYTTAFYRGLHALVHAEFRLRSRAVRLAARGRPLRGRIRDAAAVVRHAAALPLLSLRLRRLERAPHEGVTALVPRLTREMAARPSEQA